MPGKGSKRVNTSLLDETGKGKPKKKSRKSKKKVKNTSNSENHSASDLSDPGKNQYTCPASNITISHGTMNTGVNMMNQSGVNQTDSQTMFQHGISYPLQTQQFCSSPTTGMYPPQMQHISPISQSQPNIQQRPPWVDELFKRMDTFESRLNKIDQIDSIVTQINTKVIRLEQGSKTIDERLQQVEKSAQLISDNYDIQKIQFNEFKSELKNIQKSLKANISETQEMDKKLASTVSDLKRETSKLKESVLDVQIKSMNNNLIFYSIPETEGETCTDTIADFCHDIMKLENIDKTCLTDAYRLGKKGARTRPLLAKFTNFYNRELVRKNSKVLKGTVYGISEQLPTEIQNRRKEQMTLYRDLRNRGVKPYFVKDKIHVGGKEYIPP